MFGTQANINQTLGQSYLPKISNTIYNVGNFLNISSKKSEQQ